MKTKDGLMVAAGFLAILLGAMPLSGYLGYMHAPSLFHQSAFVGSVWHLLAGAVPFGGGILLLAIAGASSRQKLTIALCGILAGMFMALPAPITGNDHRAWLMWLSIVAAGCVLAVVIRWSRTTRPNTRFARFEADSG
jgi:hypothetical protein